jgi:hypothetical protein
MSSISISTEKVSGLENDWRQLFDLQLKGVEGNDEGIATKIFDAFLSCSILSAGAESCRVTMRNVIRRIQSLYLPNAYHSFFHAAHVVKYKHYPIISCLIQRVGSFFKSDA